MSVYDWQAPFVEDEWSAHEARAAMVQEVFSNARRLTPFKACQKEALPTHATASYTLVPMGVLVLAHSVKLGVACVGEVRATHIAVVRAN